MKEKWTVLVAIVSALSAFAAEVEAVPRGTIEMDPPTVGAGSITAKGTYTNQMGWAPGPVQLQTLPLGGGLQQTATAAGPPADGNWDALTVGNLAVGSYVVFALMNLTNGGMTNTVCSNVAIVTVRTPGGASPVPAGRVGYGPGDPSTGVGSVSVSKNGTYQVIDDGFTATACGLAVIPTGGGELPLSYAKVGPAPAGGNWGPITINMLPPGEYAVVGSVTMTSGEEQQSVKSPVSILTVPNQ